MKEHKTQTFADAQRLASLIAKDYAREFLRLLVVYRDISASEAASRLGLHVKTAQDFLEGMSGTGILAKREVAEKKRPYFRYALSRRVVVISLDLDALFPPVPKASILQRKIREKKGSGAIFKEGRGGRISSLHVFKGEGRSRVEKRFPLSDSQGRFLFYLPFPTAPRMRVGEIMEKAGLTDECLPEIQDLLAVLTENGILDEA